MGDLGISLKLDPEDKDGNTPQYYGKGLTKGYVTAEYEKAYLDD